MPIIAAIAALLGEMTEWRRDIHANPETAFEEHRTAALVAGKLVDWGIETHCGIGGTGVVGVLHGGDGGRRIGLRAEMDALPMQEANTFPHASRQPGKFHGCGHDGHTAMLLGAARYLAATRAFSGTVTFLFQPGEEGGGGARRMLEDGLLDRFPCDEVYAVHNRPSLPAGDIAVRAGAVMAAADEFHAHIRGRGGHAASPHHCADPVMAAVQLVAAWQPLISRRTDPLDAAVISVTELHAGSAFNVIPADAWLRGTVRTLEPRTQDRLAADMAEVAQGIARAYGVAIDLDYRRGYPVTINHPDAVARAARVAEDLVGAARVHRGLPPSMGADDFSYLLQQRPGAYLWLGTAVEGADCSLHNPNYDFNDDVLPLGASLFARLAMRPD